MRIWVKGLFFLSAYYPLFLILAILNFENYIIVGITVGITILSIISWMLLIQSSRKYNSREFKVINSENQIIDSLNYLIPYLISFMDFDPNLKEIFALMILLTIIFIVYIDTNLIFVNPLLRLFGYHIFMVKIEDISSPIKSAYRKKILLLSKSGEEHKEESRIEVKKLTKNFFYEVK